MKEETVKIKKSEIERVFKGIGQDFKIISVSIYDSFIKFRIECFHCEESHDRKLYFEKPKKNEYKGLPCRKCGTYDNTHTYSVKYPNGSMHKCFPVFCPPCLVEARGNNPSYTYTKLDD